ncbi:MAG TPA: protein-glutamate O-methyltransferase CheR [Actinophytocola sp.]|uniref:CheR family methyltransferase n=1 Tax=Actinophytocola sp. TaxID=1872138 RepID=UPI002DBD9993|nr:protein-glutamate O-methyltransferase CheR [Actinophytocola sp.]HEU5474240.1 protein-glutamate O-methyltransferase CheR [Actinophytocola sp.]
MELTFQHFNFVAELMQKEAAIVLASGKEYLVESRLKPLATKGGYETVGEFITAAAKVRENGSYALRKQIIEALTINETSWFRDREPFSALTNLVIPTLMQNITKRPIRVWSAASSSGQEPYSIAMQLDKALPPEQEYEVFATDISMEMVERTRRATYNQLEINRGLPVGDLVEYFERVGTDWHVIDRIKQRVTVEQLNLAHPFPLMVPFDVVYLRNVLIYFAPETKAQVLDRIRKVLRPGGWLQLGAAETTVGIESDFERVPVGRTAIYRAPAIDLLPVKEVKAC